MGRVILRGTLKDGLYCPQTMGATGSASDYPNDNLELDNKINI